MPFMGKLWYYGKLTIYCNYFDWAIFNSKLLVITRVYVIYVIYVPSGNLT